MYNKNNQRVFKAYDFFIKMSIYRENIRLLQYIKPAPRVISNIYHMYRAGEKAGKPFGIKFEVSALCNLRCIMCPLSKGLKRKQGILKFDNFRRVFDEVRPPYLNLTGIGEPLLNPDLFKIIRYAGSKGSIVKLDTNATLLDDEKARMLLASKPNIVSISIDGINKESYEKIRVGGKFEIVIKNLKNFIEIRNKTKSRTKIHVNFVLQKSNISELIEFIKYIDSLGVDSINGDIALPLGANKNKENRKVDRNIAERLKSELKKLKTRASLNIEHIHEFIKCEESNRKKNCFYPWYYPSITWDGNMVPCCYICDNEIVFGNVLEEGFMNVWNNKKTREFRKMIAKGREGICKNCFIDETFIADKMRVLHKTPIIRRLSARKTI